MNNTWKYVIILVILCILGLGVWLQFAVSNTQKVKVSVIVPVYNAEKTIRRTMDSLLKQTLGKIEIIVVDDGSTDGTAKILDEYAAQNEHVKVIHQENSYVGTARNEGRKQATGDYIAFIDADDTVSEDYFEKMYKTAKAHKADVVAAENVVFVWENKDNLEEPYKERADFTKNDVIEDLAPYRAVVDGYVWDKIYRRQWLDEHNIWCSSRRTPAEDNFFTTPVLMYAGKMYVAKGATYYYHRGNSSETGVKYTEAKDEIIDMFADLRGLILSSDLDNAQKTRWLTATDEARQRIVSDYVDCLVEGDKAAVQEKIREFFPEDMVIFSDNYVLDKKHSRLYQKI